MIVCAGHHVDVVVLQADPVTKLLKFAIQWKT